MTNKEKYVNCFVEALEVEPSVVEDLEYQGVISWDSVGHMSLIAAIEDAFEIMLDAEDILELTSYDRAKAILAKYEIEI